MVTVHLLFLIHTYGIITKFWQSLYTHRETPIAVLKLRNSNHPMLAALSQTTPVCAQGEAQPRAETTKVKVIACSESAVVRQVKII